MSKRTGDSTRLERIAQDATKAALERVWSDLEPTNHRTLETRKQELKAGAGDRLSMRMLPLVSALDACLEGSRMPLGRWRGQIWEALNAHRVLQQPFPLQQIFTIQDSPRFLAWVYRQLEYFALLDVESLENSLRSEPSDYPRLERLSMLLRVVSELGPQAADPSVRTLLILLLPKSTRYDLIFAVLESIRYTPAGEYAEWGEPLLRLFVSPPAGRAEKIRQLFDDLCPSFPPAFQKYMAPGLIKEMVNNSRFDVPAWAAHYLTSWFDNLSPEQRNSLVETLIRNSAVPQRSGESLVAMRQRVGADDQDNHPQWLVGTSIECLSRLADKTSHPDVLDTLQETTTKSGDDIAVNALMGMIRAEAEDADNLLKRVLNPLSTTSLTPNRISQLGAALGTRSRLTILLEYLDREMDRRWPETGKPDQTLDLFENGARVRDLAEAIGQVGAQCDQDTARWMRCEIVRRLERIRTGRSPHEIPLQRVVCLVKLIEGMEVAGAEESILEFLLWILIAQPKFQPADPYRWHSHIAGARRAICSWAGAVPNDEVLSKRLNAVLGRQGLEAYWEECSRGAEPWGGTATLQKSLPLSGKVALRMAGGIAGLLWHTIGRVANPDEFFRQYQQHRFAAALANLPVALREGEVDEYHQRALRRSLPILIGELTARYAVAVALSGLGKEGFTEDIREVIASTYPVRYTRNGQEKRTNRIAEFKEEDQAEHVWSAWIRQGVRLMERSVGRLTWIQVGTSEEFDAVAPALDQSPVSGKVAASQEKIAECLLRIEFGMPVARACAELGVSPLQLHLLQIWPGMRVRENYRLSRVCYSHKRPTHGLK